MLSYYLDCRKNRGSKITKIAQAKNRRIILLSKCAVCENKKSKFAKQQEAG